MSKFALAPETDGKLYPAPEPRNLTQVTERHEKGTCSECGLPLYEDDTGEWYCEGCD